MGRNREMSISLMVRGVSAWIGCGKWHNDPRRYQKDTKEGNKAASSSSSIMSNLPDGYVVQHFSRSAANNRQKPSEVVAFFWGRQDSEQAYRPTGNGLFGPLQEWQNYLLDVHDFYVNQPSSRKNVDCQLASSDVHEERVFVGDGKGLQGRFQQSVGQVVGAVLEALSSDL
ncbi:hypothetical protein PENFLA_c005G09118 [Penicillium flavigenum]|uniref:Uncharacterized protein n=1 Tax=Penicillium flavigenum TaxID=254877 RepID=A0A1V6TNN3_9EURO|nr:hypothetical protein PENFLA_c005G09118 [Penicillium flavigenum]